MAETVCCESSMHLQEVVDNIHVPSFSPREETSTVPAAASTTPPTPTPTSTSPSSTPTSAVSSTSSAWSRASSSSTTTCSSTTRMRTSSPTWLDPRNPSLQDGVFDGEEPWIQQLLPAAGITVKHIRTCEDVALCDVQLLISPFKLYFSQFTM